MMRAAQGYQADTHTLAFSKSVFIYHMNAVCAVLQTAFCACRHKRKQRATPAERSAAHGDLPLQYQNHIPR